MAEQPIDEWYARYGASVYRRCFRVLKNHERAQDATQDVFLIAHRKSHQFRGESSPLTWLYRIATRHALRLAKREERYASSGDTQDIHDTSPEASAELDHRRVLARVLNASGERDREILCYLYFDGLTQDEVAEKIGISRRAVVKRLSKWRSTFESQTKELLA